LDLGSDGGISEGIPAPCHYPHFRNNFCAGTSKAVSPFIFWQLGHQNSFPGSQKLFQEASSTTKWRTNEVRKVPKTDAGQVLGQWLRN